MLDEVVSEVAPDLDPKTYYGFPAYARDGKIVVFFQPASKFKTRFGTLAFDEAANLDDGEMWPTAFAVTSTATTILPEQHQRATKAAG